MTGFKIVSIPGVPDFTPDDAMDATEAFLVGGSQGVSFGAADELEGGVRALIAKAQGDERSLGELFEAETQAARDRLNRVQKERPFITSAGELAGALILPGGVAKKAATTVQGAKRGAVVGAGQGAAFGFGTEEGGLENRLEGAKRGALVGAVAGAPLGAVAQRSGRIADDLPEGLEVNVPTGRLQEVDASRRFVSGPVEPGTPRQVAAAAERESVPVSFGQATDSPALRSTFEATRNLPVVGRVADDAARETQGVLAGRFERTVQRQSGRSDFDAEAIRRDGLEAFRRVTERPGVLGGDVSGAFLQASTKGGNIRQLENFRRGVSDDDWQKISAMVILDMGRRGGREFDSQFFFNQFERMTGKARQLFFGPFSTNTRRSIEQIARIAQRLPSSEASNRTARSRIAALGLGGAALVGFDAMDVMQAAGAVLGGGSIVGAVLSRRVTAAQAERWTRAFERFVQGPSRATRRALEASSRAFGSRIAEELGAPERAKEVTQVLSGDRPLNEPEQVTDQTAEFDQVEAVAEQLRAQGRDDLASTLDEMLNQGRITEAMQMVNQLLGVGR